MAQIEPGSLYVLNGDDDNNGGRPATASSTSHRYSNPSSNVEDGELLLGLLQHTEMTMPVDPLSSIWTDIQQDAASSSLEIGDDDFKGYYDNPSLPVSPADSDNKKKENKKKRKNMDQAGEVGGGEEGAAVKYKRAKSSVTAQPYRWIGEESVIFTWMFLVHEHHQITRDILKAGGVPNNEIEPSMHQLLSTYFPGRTRRQCERRVLTMKRRGWYKQMVSERPPMETGPFKMVLECVNGVMVEKIVSREPSVASSSSSPSPPHHHDDPGEWTELLSCQV